MKYLALILALAFAAAASAQPPRCWTNDQGVTECGTRPPPGVDARDVRVARPAVSPEVEEAERFAEADVGEEEQVRLAIQRRRCDLARETLAAYERSDFLYEREPTGERRELDEEEAAEVMAIARLDVEHACTGLDGE